MAVALGGRRDPVAQILLSHPLLAGRCIAAAGQSLHASPQPPGSSPGAEAPTRTADEAATSKAVWGASLRQAGRPPARPPMALPPLDLALGQ